MRDYDITRFRGSVPPFLAVLDTRASLLLVPLTSSAMLAVVLRAAAPLSPPFWSKAVSIWTNIDAHGYKTHRT